MGLGGSKAYLHDVVSIDRRNPTTNANGLLYGATELSTDYLPVLDPMTNKISQVPLSVLDSNTKSASGEVAERSPYWGGTAIWNGKTNVHNPMFDKEGRVWITAIVRPSDVLTSARKVLITRQQKLFLLTNHTGSSVSTILSQGNTLP